MPQGGAYPLGDESNWKKTGYYLSIGQGRGFIDALLNETGEKFQLPPMALHENVTEGRFILNAREGSLYL